MVHVAMDLTDLMKSVIIRQKLTLLWKANSWVVIQDVDVYIMKLCETVTEVYQRLADFVKK